MLRTKQEKLYEVKLKYIVPNLVTLTGMTFGLISVFYSIKACFFRKFTFLETSAWFIVYSVLFDKLDGTVASLLKAKSKFGAEMDSFSDLVTFGIAPSILFVSMFYLLGKISFPLTIAVHTIAVIFIASSALRLAKFNVLTEKVGDKYFLGLPTTSAGGMVALFYLLSVKYMSGSTVAISFPILMFVLAYLMISNVKVPKLKKNKNKLLNYFIMTNVVLAYIFGFLRIFPEYLMAILLIYLFFGIGYYLFKK